MPLWVKDFVEIPLWIITTKIISKNRNEFILFDNSLPIGKERALLIADC
jgi:hypothetical protein